MSKNASRQPNSSGGDEQRDWRRRRRRPQGRREPAPPAEPTNPLCKEAEPDAPEDRRASRTLASFIEPSLDAVGRFGAPIVVAGVVGLVAGTAVVAFVGSMRVYGFVDIAIGGGLILLVALISMSSVVAAFFSRTGRYGVNATIMVLAFTGIVVVINFLSFENNSRSDVTATNQFSLARSTKELLKNLEEPVQATAFYPETTNLGRNPGQGALDRIARRAKVEETFREFKAARSSKFKYRFVDSTLEPEVVREYFGATPTPFINDSIVVEGLNSGITHLVQPGDQDYSKLEQSLYTSILVVSGQERKTVYFLAGHGERVIDTTSSTPGGDAEGYDNVRIGLEADNYDVRTLHWNEFDEEVAVPDTSRNSSGESCAPDDPRCLPDAALVVIAGPKADLPLAHAQALDKYLRGRTTDEAGNLVERAEGGRLIFLAEPDTPGTFLDFMASWGVLIGQGYIRDQASSVPDLPQTLQIQSFNPLQLPEQVTRTINPSALRTLLGITAPKGQSLGVIRMPGAAPLRVTSDPNRASAPLAFSSPDSYLIDDLGRTEPITTGGEESDPRGPFSPAIYVQAVGPVGSPERTTSPDDSEIAAMVVFGDSDFINNVNFHAGSGADFFLNSANYLLGDYSLVAIRPKAFSFRELNLDRNEYNFVRFSSWLFMPGILGLMAALVWWVRR